MSTDSDPIIFRQWTEKLRGQLSVETYDRFFGGMELLDWNPDRLRVSFPAESDLSRLERLYGGILEEALRELTGKEMRVELLARDSAPAAAPAPSSAPESDGNILPGIDLNPGYTFETFVEGSNSLYAVAAAKAVAQNPGGAYNPLLIYGGSGLGKTHLLHAIANGIRRSFPQKTIRYITADAFRTEYTDAISRTKQAFGDRNQIREMDDFYRNKVDVLLMDDVQLLAATEGVQVQLFHIFNALHDSRRQIVLASDRPVAEIANLEERLVTRFQGGLCLDIQPPDVETREAILRDKIRRLDSPLLLDDEALRLIATQTPSDIRSLESVLRKLLFTQTIRKTPIDSAMIESVLHDFPQGPSLRATPGAILSAVCDEFSVEEARMLEKGRGTQEVAFARMVAMTLMKQLTKMSLKSIGAFFGGRDHSTVISAVRKVENAVQTDARTRSSMERIRTKLR